MALLTELQEFFSDYEMNLPGFDAQRTMAPPQRQNYDLERIKHLNPRPAAVLIMLYENNLGEVEFPIILRNTYDGVHSGQFGLPGGSFEEGDISFENTAVRETCEELGVFEENLEIIKPLTELYVPPSDFLVYPYVGIHHGTPDFKPDESEVQEIVQIDLQAFLQEEPANFEINGAMDIPAYQLGDDEFLWGATAMILQEFKTLILENI